MSQRQTKHKAMCSHPAPSPPCSPPWREARGFDLACSQLLPYFRSPHPGFRAETDPPKTGKPCPWAGAQVLTRPLSPGKLLASSCSSNAFQPRGGERWPASSCGYLDQWLVSCGGFSACAQFRLPLLILVQGRKCGGAQVSQARTSAEQALLTDILAITCPWFVNRKDSLVTHLTGFSVFFL